MSRQVEALYLQPVEWILQEQKNLSTRWPETQPTAVARATMHSYTILPITPNPGRILQHFQKGICQEKAKKKIKERTTANARVKIKKT